MTQNNKILIYQWKNGEIELRMDTEKETIWATQADIIQLFEVDQSVISRHIRNIFQDGEVDAKSNMQKMHNAISDKPVNLYSLDIILAVGYRANSANAIKFRQWATTRLREYLVQGYTINQKRLDELGKTIKLLAATGKKIDENEVKWILDIIANYTESFLLLNRFDSGNLIESGDENITYIIRYEEAKEAIRELKAKLMGVREATELFGNEKDESFTGILSNVVATFDGVYLYPTIEEQAAHLLYFIIKDHPFSDGNKRIGAFLFIWFLEKNKHRLREDGEAKINDTGLATLAILIASSDPREKEMMIKLVVNLINGK